MDEGTLNDLLECSVCLERLDTSSKVLPCQHTFCKKCLEEILGKHKELRCPECRVLVQVKVEDLPPNVLLMRILEGMKNAGNPVLKKVHRTNRSPNQLQANPVAYPAAPVHHQHGTPDHRTTSNKHQNMQIAPHQPYAIAAYDYTSREAGDLSFKRGDVIILRKRIDNNWYQGECGGKQGVFPVSYVQIITPVPSHLPQCKALYDFRMGGGDEEEGCLSFRKGDIINVIRRVDENWAEGKLDGRIGIFPLSFVELNDLARSLMKLSTNVQPGPSRLAPPTPTNEETSPLIPTDHTRTVINQRRSPQTNTNQLERDHQSKQPPLRSDSSSGGTSSSTTTPNASSSNASSSSSTAPSSPATPPPRGQQAPPPPQQLPPKNIAPKPDILMNSAKSTTPQKSSSHSHVSGNRSPDVHAFTHHQDKEKRHSFSSMTVPQQTTTNHNRHSAEILACEVQVSVPNVQVPERSRRNGNTPAVELQLPATYVALYAYKPQKTDELELKKGNIYMVTERCQDGWFKGTSNRTQKCGVFPGNYVVPARGAHVPSASGNSSGTCPARPVKGGANQTAPELPPRAVSPAPSSISSSWHGQENNRQEIGRSSSQAVVGANSKDKSKERKDKGTVSLMRRLTSIKRSKSPPPSSYSMDNPVFEDAQATAKSSSPAHPIHVRSGSCPSQLLQLQPNDHRLFGSTSQRHKHKERPTILTHTAAVASAAVSRTPDHPGSSNSSPDIHRHRKSNSLDAGNKTSKTGVQTVRERFRCIAPYPPNSEYELELQVNDIIYVHKKREDGWYKGTQQRTGKTGLFPASFVESY